MKLSPALARAMPGLAALLAYRREDLRHDLSAGLAVAAVAVPVGVAYAPLAGLPPAAGLYASLLPMLAYALFGTSRQLIVGPDAATCALIAAAVAPLAGGDAQRYAALSALLALMAGAMCIVGSRFRLGALADFLSRPILLGFMNGVALSIAAGQLGRMSGIRIDAAGDLPRLFEFVRRLPSAHLPTLLVAGATLALMVGVQRRRPRVPAALVALVAGAAFVAASGLEARGVATIGAIAPGLPAFALPSLAPDDARALLPGALGLALVSYVSMTLTARSFAARNGYEVDADRELGALGAANVASALSQGFAISGADSRTAASDAAGGRTQLTGLVAAAVIALVLLFLTAPLRHVPVAALGAVLLRSALSLIDVAALRRMYRIDVHSALLSLLATLAVIAVGAIEGILLAVVLALAHVIRLLARPSLEVLGEVDGQPGFHALVRHPGAVTPPRGLVLRFNGPIVFFNAAAFKAEVLRAAERAGAQLRWVVLDMLPVTMVDATGVAVAEEVIDVLDARGITFVAAGRQTEWQRWTAERRGVVAGNLVFFATLRQAVRHCSAMPPAVPVPSSPASTSDP